MVRTRLAGYRDRVRGEFEAAFRETHPPRTVAGSFALGVFVTMLPTFGTGLLVFALVAATVERVSKLAMVASLVVVNPVVKWGVYGASFWLGSRLLGPVPGFSPADASLSAGPDVVVRVVVGNLLLAVVATVVGYVAVLHLVRAFRRRDLELADVVPVLDPE